MRGVVIHLGKSYGFIKDLEGGVFYFNFRSLSLGTEFEWLEMGSEVRFTKRLAEKGPCAAYVQMVDSPDVEIKEGRLYVERAGKTFRMWMAGEEVVLKPGYRILENLECVTDYYPDIGGARAKFRAQAAYAGANYPQDVRIEVAIRLVAGFAVNSVRCRGVIGVLVKPMWVKNPDQKDSLDRQYGEKIQARLAKLSRYRDEYDSLVQNAA